MARPKTNSVSKTITLTKDLYEDAERTANDLGVSFPEYVRYLILDDKRRNLRKIEIADEELEKDLKEAWSDYKKGNTTVLKTDEDIEDHLNSVVTVD